MGNIVDINQKRRGPKLILETPALAPVHEEACPFKVTLWFYLSNIQTKHWAVYRKFCHFVFSLMIITLCQTLSNAIEISRKTPLLQTRHQRTYIFHDL